MPSSDKSNADVISSYESAMIGTDGLATESTEEKEDEDLSIQDQAAEVAVMRE